MASPSSRSSSSQSKRVQIDDFLWGLELGVGAFARVVHAIHKESGREYAVKVMEKSWIRKNNKVQAVLIERDVAARVHHPLLTKLAFTWQDNDCLFMAFDLARCGDCRAAWQALRAAEADGSVTAEQRAETVRLHLAQIIAALEYLHTELRVAHRDIKSDNVLCSESGYIKLADFGTALQEDADEGSGASAFVGTADYVSPEVLVDAGSHAPADLWAVGCMVWEAFAGAAPFSGGTEFLTFQNITSYSRQVLKALQADDAAAGAADEPSPRPSAQQPAGSAAGAQGADDSDDDADSNVLQARALSVPLVYRRPTAAEAQAAGLSMPDHMPAAAVDLALALLHPHPMSRLGAGSDTSAAAAAWQEQLPAGTSVPGYSELKAHPYFAGIDWAGLCSSAATAQKYLHATQSAHQEGRELGPAPDLAVKAPWHPAARELPPPMDTTHLSWESVGEVLALKAQGRQTEATNLLASLKESYVDDTMQAADEAAAAITPSSAVRAVLATPVPLHGPSFNLHALQRSLQAALSAVPSPRPDRLTPAASSGTPSPAADPASRSASRVSRASTASAALPGGAVPLPLPVLPDTTWADMWWAPLLAKYLGRSAAPAVPSGTPSGTVLPQVPQLGSEPSVGVVYWGPVGKKRGMVGRTLQRDLVITNAPSMVYFDAGRQILKGEIPWDARMEVRLLDARWFALKVPSIMLSYRVEAVDDDGHGIAAMWVRVLHDMLQLASSPVALEELADAFASSS